ncbi:MAG: hypothetical protein ACRDRX_25625 [Pseudonocardiaceae bacterium]
MRSLEFLPPYTPERQYRAPPQKPTIQPSARTLPAKKHSSVLRAVNLDVKSLLILQRSAGNQAVVAALSVQRKPDDTKQSGSGAGPPKVEKTVPKKGLSRTLYVIQNELWNKLPPVVRSSAEQELNRLFSFVGAANDQKKFSIKILPAAKLPEQFDFTESVVAVIQGDPGAYVQDAFDRQEKQINEWFSKQKLPTPRTSEKSKTPFSPELLGRGGANKRIFSASGKKFAVSQMVGAVVLNEVIDSFVEDVDNLITKALEKHGRKLDKWPVEVDKRRPLEMFGQSLGRVIAHEARHEYLVGHAEEGLGQDAPYVTGEKNAENFSKEDQKAMLKRIQDLEAQQGKATAVPIKAIDE